MAANGAARRHRARRCCSARRCAATTPRPLWVTAWGGTNTLAQALIARPRGIARPSSSAPLVSRCSASMPSPTRMTPVRGCGESSRTCISSASPSTQDGQEYTAATWTGMSGYCFYRNAPGADFPHLHGRHGSTPTSGCSRAARQALSVSLLHPRGRHAFVPRPHRQRPRQRDEPDLRRLGRPVRLASTAWAAVAVWTQGGDAYPGRAVVARHRAPGSDAQMYTSDQAVIWRWREAFQHDFAARMDVDRRALVRGREPQTRRWS